MEHYEHVIKPIKDLIPYARNSKIHTDKQVTQISSSMKEFGFTNPVLIDETNGIIAGHGRILAAEKLKYKDAPCIILSGLTDAQKRAYVIADNKIAENAGWDEEMLKLEIMDLDGLEFDLGLLGFDDDELDDLLDLGEKEEGNTDPDEVPEPPDDPVSKAGDVWVLGDHRLMCGDSTDHDAVATMMDGDLADQLITDPPYNVDYVGKTKEALTIQNDSMDDNAFLQFLIDLYKSADNVMKPGAVFYIWHADSEGYNFRGAAKAVDWKVRQCIIWNKDSMVLGRQDYHWKHEPCQPAGTMVRTPDGSVPIENLKDGDRVISFDKNSGCIKGLKDGVPIKTASRQYDGNLYGIGLCGLETWTTDSHKFTVKFNPESTSMYCVYLMKKENWWRIGITSTYNARGFGVKHRMRQEDADCAWILDTYDTKQEAEIFEEVYSLRYGIPTTHWEPERGFKSRNYNARDKEFINRIYENLDLNLLEINCQELLESFGRRSDMPLIDRQSRTDKFSTRVTIEVPACNVIPGLMQVPVPFAGYDGNKTFRWETIEKVNRKPHSGPVYSLEVEKYEHYIADGIVTHNCLYGWKEGAGHLWNSDRKQTTILNFDRPKRNDLHPTMKPVDLIEYQIENNTKGKDIVLDLCGGSGTTLMASHRTGRCARLMEIDPIYCDVIVNRWQDHTGLAAVHKKSGKTYNELLNSEGS